MNHTTKSVVSALGVLASVAVVVLGLAARQRADVGAVSSLGNKSIVGLLASRSDDVNVPAGDYFYELSQKLKEEYVEPVTDDQKLASGAIRGMVTSLKDPQSTFMDKNQFVVFLNAREGRFEGIGADFDLVVGPGHKQAEVQIDTTDMADATPEDTLAVSHDIPRLEVVSVIPGGPADKAGVQVGDIVNSVDGHWVVNADLVRKFRAAQAQFLAKKLSIGGLNLMRNELRAKADKAIYPQRAHDMLFMGRSGEITVVWDRGDKQRTTKIVKVPCALPGFGVHNGVIRLPFEPNSDVQLKQAISEKTAVTIDLRNNTLGDLTSMRRCLGVLVPAGQYGNFVTYRHESATPLVVQQGNSKPPKITLLTDRSTRGVAEIFALALSSRGYAHIEGGSMGGDRDSRAIFHMPDGSGYTLVTSIYKPTLGSSRVVRKGGVK